MPVTIETKPLDREQFRSRLLGAVCHVEVERTRFYRALTGGRCPNALVRTYAYATIRSAEAFCNALATMIDAAPDARSRLVLLENLMEEQGIIFRPNIGLVSNPDASHVNLARRFAKAFGASGDCRGAVNALSAGCDVLSRGKWVEAIAHLLVGQEYNFSRIAPAIGEALLQWGLSKRDIAFFLVHAEADCRHGEEALEMVLYHARGRAQQDRCISEARAGADAWLAAHGGLVH